MKSCGSLHSSHEPAAFRRHCEPRPCDGADGVGRRRLDRRSEHQDRSEGLPTREAFFVEGGRATSGSRYIAIALAGGVRAAGLRDAVAAAVDGEARVLRTSAGVAAVCEVGDGADARAEAERVRIAVADALGDDQMSAGVAGPKLGTSGAHFALVQAEHALVIGRALHGPRRTTHFDELGAYCFVLNQPAHEVRSFAERVLGPLIAEETYAELVDTLEAYLRTHGNLNAVARQLYLHRNTVRHRLRRIAKLTGADLDDPDTRLGLQLAILSQRALARIAS